MVSVRRVGTLCATVLLGARSVMGNGIQLDTSDPASIKAPASTLAYGMMKYYSGNQTGQTVGVLPQPYYWWEAGAMFGAMIDYWYYTGDSSYNDVVSEALLSQTGPDDDFMPREQQKDEGNDDQGFWGLAAMSAAEVNFPNPPSDKPQWLALAQAVFNSQAIRWDYSTCGGGLRWQIFTFNNGYNYKNAISNGCFFNIAARLGAYTGNTTYLDWAERTWDWMQGVGLLGAGYQVYDGSDDTINCTQINHIQWSYNAGVFLYGAAMMWNKTGDDKWQSRAQKLWNASSVFFTGPNNQIMYEVACEPGHNCDTDQLSFKAYLARWMAASTKVAPWLIDSIMPYINASAVAAVSQCNGGTDGVTCGTNWNSGGVWDGTYGVGQQMSALEVVQSTLIGTVRGPLGNKTGGTSIGNPNAGTSGDKSPGLPQTPIKTADKAGAGILTALVLIGLVGGAWWMII